MFLERLHDKSFGSSPIIQCLEQVSVNNLMTPQLPRFIFCQNVSHLGLHHRRKRNHAGGLFFHGRALDYITRAPDGWTEQRRVVETKRSVTNSIVKSTTSGASTMSAICPPNLTQLAIPDVIPVRFKVGMIH